MHLDRLLSLVTISSVVLALHLTLDPLHLLNLSFPLLSTHLRFLRKELLVWCTIAASDSVPKREVLAVIVVEVKMVHSMARSSVNNRAVHDEFAVVNEDRPHVDEDEQTNISHLLKWEDEWEDVVWDTLRKSIKRVESVGRKWCRHNPLMMWLMQRLIDKWVVQTAVNEVDEEVGEEEEERKLEPLVPSSWTLGGGVVELRITLKFRCEADCGEERHQWHGGVGLNHLQLDLVLQELWMCEGCVVEDEVVGGGGDDEVEEETEEPGQWSDCVLCNGMV